MNIVTQPKPPGRLVTPGPLKLQTEKDPTARRPTRGALDVGCVDWYLYPVSKELPPPADSHAAPSGGDAA